MRKLLTKIAIAFTLAILGVVCVNGQAAAQVKNITVSNNETLEVKGTVGDEGQIVLADSQMWQGQNVTIHYECYETSSFSITSEGYYKALAPDYATVYVTVEDENYNYLFRAEIQFTIFGDVSEMTLEKQNVAMYSTSSYTWMTTQVKLLQAPDLSFGEFQYVSSNAKMDVSCELDRETNCLTISSYSTGKTQLTITINGKVFKLNVTCYQLAINKYSLVLAKGKKATLKVKGYKGKVKWKTTNKKLCTVSSTGVVKAKKKTGTAVVYYTVDGQRVGCAVSVVTPQMKKVVSTAYSIAKGKYSQAKRMQKGYYDCSSLVWRAYQKAGKSLGNKHYAPVAADIAKYLFCKKKRIKGGLSYTNIQKKKLRPGDLFFEGGAKNGRYKGIYHVEMFTGYACAGFNANGTPVLVSCWAARPMGYYYSGMMARP
ncbi:MAG: C40 family peptidase [Eubacterium sp.]|nr:C40 family peptidase [Eubacterium sp.]